jgi:hypothetical protein
MRGALAKFFPTRAGVAFSRWKNVSNIGLPNKPQCLGGIANLSRIHNNSRKEAARGQGEANMN